MRSLSGVDSGDSLADARGGAGKETSKPTEATVEADTTGVAAEAVARWVRAHCVIVARPVAAMHWAARRSEVVPPTEEDEWVVDEAERRVRRALDLDRAAAWLHLHELHAARHVGLCATQRVVARLHKKVSWHSDVEVSRAQTDDARVAHIEPSHRRLTSASTPPHPHFH